MNGNIIQSRLESLLQEEHVVKASRASIDPCAASPEVVQANFRHLSPKEQSSRVGEGHALQTPILVVDGFRPVLQIFVEALTKAGYAARGVPDGRAAIDLLRARRYALIVCSYQMEGITGLDVLEATRRHARGTPVILVSGVPSEIVAAAAYARGAFAVLAKPISMSDLLTTVHDALAAIPGREERAG
jgi:CheY-like chemotaxis protein